MKDLTVPVEDETYRPARVKAAEQDMSVPVIRRMDETRFKSPEWHENALEKTAACYKAGEEQPRGWAAAKRELRKRG